MHHVTLTTGHARESARFEIDDSLMPILQQHLSEALAGASVLVPNSQPSCTLTAAASGDDLIATVWGPGARGERAPIVTLGVSRSDGAALWRQLHTMAQGLRTRPNSPPAAPWCGAVLLPGAVIHPAAMEWLGDYERCLAWAWIERQ